MSFVDHAILKIKAGKGGDGVVRWRREKAVAYGGPAGGNGGKGGNVYVEGWRNLHTLSNYRHQTDFAAEDAGAGGNKKMHGADGDDLVLKFPLGTTLYIKEIDKTIDIMEEGEKILLFTGGDGGLGNDHFKSSVNRSPEEFTKGKIGEYGTVTVELKMIADVGLIGFPNAGKSSLLNTLTKAQSKVGNYNFTTLEPHLGDYFGYILADIPGLIEGASDGKGLGHKFLKHVERTKMLVHMIEAKQTLVLTTEEENLANKNSDKIVTDYTTIRQELGKFNPELLNKEEIIVVSKIDMLTADEKKDVKKQISTLAKIAKCKVGDIVQLSLYDDESVKDFEKVLMRKLKA
jgi:GTPase